MKRHADFSGFLAETFDLLGDGFRYFAIFVLAVGGLNSVGVTFDLAEPSGRIFGMGFHIDRQEGMAPAAFGILAAAFGIVAQYFLTARLLGVRNALMAGSTRIWAFVGMQILWLLGFVLGLLLLVIPGLILLVRWSATSGFLIGSRKGIRESFSASWRATSGHSWAIFFAGLVLFIGLIVVAGAIGALFGVLDVSTLTDVVSTMLEAVGNAAFASFGVAVYYLVYDGSEEISEVFA